MRLVYPRTFTMSTKPALPVNPSQQNRGSESCLGQKSDSSWKILEIESEQIKREFLWIWMAWIYWFPCSYNGKLTKNLITWYKFTFAESLKRQSKSLFYGWFPLTRFWLRTLTHVSFNHVNEIEARFTTCKVLRLKVKLSEVLVLRLRATFHTLPIFYLRT